MPDYYTSAAYFKEYPKAETGVTPYHLSILPGKIILNDSIDFSSATKKQIADSLSKIIDSNPGNKNRLYLNANDELFFDRFLDYYTFFKNNPVDKLQLSPKIFIFTP